MDTCPRLTTPFPLGFDLISEFAPAHDTTKYRNQSFLTSVAFDEIPNPPDDVAQFLGDTRAITSIYMFQQRQPQQSQCVLRIGSGILISFLCVNIIRAFVCIGDIRNNISYLMFALWEIATTTTTSGEID